MKTLIRNLVAVLATSAGLGTAQAGVLTYQDVAFTTTWSNNVLTLEIDAAQHSGDWSRATKLGALSIKDIGSFQSVTVTAAPKGVEVWKMSALELTAKGCSGGSGGGKKSTNTSLCLTGAPIALTDNMVFSFAFTGGTPDLDTPHVKVNFLDASNNKIGDLLSRSVPATQVGATPPAATPPVTTPPATTPPVTTPPATTPPGTTPPAGGTLPVKETFPVDGGANDSPVPPPTVITQPVLVLEPLPDAAKDGEVPEPGAIALLLGGLALMGVALRKRG